MPMAEFASPQMSQFVSPRCRSNMITLHPQNISIIEENESNMIDEAAGQINS
ncbi:hypothetical protein A2U01_0050405, partial [Trifolium medium]|nr:hypothetical protein [Trifolium medium]